MNTEAPEAPQEIVSIETEAIEIRKAGGILRIPDQAGYDRVVQNGGVIKEFLAKVDEHYDPLINKANSLVKDLKEAKNKHAGPLVFMQTVYRGSLVAWSMEQRRIQEQKQREIDAAHQAQVKIETSVQVAAAKDRGASRAEVAEIKRDIVATPAPVAAPTYAPSKAATVSDHWVAEITDFAELVKWVAKNTEERLQYLEPSKLEANHPNLNAAARAQNSRLAIPGVNAVNKGKAAFRG